MSSRKKHEGYLLVDHRSSPGLPEDIARMAGYDPQHCGEGKMYEQASLTCAHCKNVVIKNPLRTRAREYCIKCDHYICDGCGKIREATGGACRTFTQLIEEQQELAEREKQIILI